MTKLTVKNDILKQVVYEWKSFQGETSNSAKESDFSLLFTLTEEQASPENCLV